MDLQKSCRRLAAWVLTLALAAALALPGGAVYAMPIQTANAQESVYLINAVTGEVLLDQNSGQQRCVASLTKMMTARAAQLGCTSTRFSCPHGLYDDGNVSTAQDMGKIAIACAQYEIYRQIADTLQYEIPVTNLHAARSIRSTNKMLDPENSCYRAYIHGMKTGFTTKAGRCYVTAAQQGDTIYGLVILGSDRKNIYAEAAAILDWAFAGCPQQQAAA